MIPFGLFSLAIAKNQLLFKNAITFLFLIDINNYSAHPTWRNISPAQLAITLFGTFSLVNILSKISLISINIRGLLNVLYKNYIHVLNVIKTQLEMVPFVLFSLFIVSLKVIKVILKSINIYGL